MSGRAFRPQYKASDVIVIVSNYWIRLQIMLERIHTSSNSACYQLSGILAYSRNVSEAPVRPFRLKSILNV